MTGAGTLKIFRIGIGGDKTEANLVTQRVINETIVSMSAKEFKFITTSSETIETIMCPKNVWDCLESWIVAAYADRILDTNLI